MDTLALRFNDATRDIDYASAMVLVFLVGTNLSFIFHAGRLFHKDTCRFWRWFFTGKTMISGILVDALLEHPGPVVWQLLVVDMGAIISLFALWIIFKDRPYRNIDSAENHEFKS